MNFFSDLFSNVIFVSAAIGWMVAQVAKTIIHAIITKKFVAERLVGSGGMPSCHSATVCALSTATAMECGASSPEFAISVMLAIIVMYDAMGVRRETGIQAKILNEMIEVFTKMGKKMSAEEKLKEFIGHTPLQVLIGAILGIIIALVMRGVLVG